MGSAGRTLLLLAFSLYWGGLTFYTGFVVRISHDVLADAMDGGLITQRVTSVLQMLGAVTVVLMAFNAIAVTRKVRSYGYVLIACTVVLALALMGLFLVHGQLDAIIDVEDRVITDRENFDRGHRRYNQLTTIQWLASLAYLPVTLVAWRSTDARMESPSSDNS